MTYTADLRAQIREPGQAESGTLKVHEMIDPTTAMCGEEPQVWKGIQLVWSPLLGRGGSQLRELCAPQPAFHPLELVATEAGP